MKAHILEAGRIRVEFERLGDRWSHRLSVQSQGQWLPIAASVEGSDHELWPPSPPIQELHFETHNGSPVALGVGMSGSSHWSLCVTVDPETEAIAFEVACRAKSVSERLQSKYEAPFSIKAESTSECVLSPAESSIQKIIITPLNGESRILADPSVPARPTVTVHPASPAGVSKQTQCWGYRFTAEK